MEECNELSLQPCLGLELVPAKALQPILNSSEVTSDCVEDLLYVLHYFYLGSLTPLAEDFIRRN